MSLCKLIMDLQVKYHYYIPMCYFARYGPKPRTQPTCDGHTDGQGPSTG